MTIATAVRQLFSTVHRVESNGSGRRAQTQSVADQVSGPLAVLTAIADVLKLRAVGAAPLPIFSDSVVALKSWSFVESAGEIIGSCKVSLAANRRLASG